MGTDAATGSVFLIAATLTLPLAMLLACLWRPARERMPGLLWFAPLPALATALTEFEGHAVKLPQAFLGMTFVVDHFGAMLLAASAILWIAAGADAATTTRDDSNQGRFVVWWLLTLVGSVGIFMAADLIGFYLFFTIVSLAAYGLVVFDETPEARRAGTLYVAAALIGEAFLLMGFVLLASGSPDGSLLISDAAAAIAHSPWRNAALVCIVLGFGLKVGLVPLHVWMPLTYTAAPIPAAAVLSGAAVKAGVIFVRFLPVEASLPHWGEAVAAAGFFSAFYGAAIGVTQRNPKTVLAYSSISQMGLLTAVIGMGMITGRDGATAGVIFYAMHHTLVKGGLFLAVGLAPLISARERWLVLLPAAVVALGFGGLPFTGGALAKYAIKDALGYGIAGWLGNLSAVASTVLMLHFLMRLTATIGREPAPASVKGKLLPWLGIAVCAVALPWAIYPWIGTGGVGDLFSPAAIWSALWPVLIGGGLMLVLARFGDKVPDLPPGDIIVLGERAAPAVSALIAKMDGLDAQLRRWPVAGFLLVALTLTLIGLMIGAH